MPTGNSRLHRPKKSHTGRVLKPLDWPFGQRGRGRDLTPLIRAAIRQAKRRKIKDRAKRKEKRHSWIARHTRWSTPPYTLTIGGEYGRER